jgi:NADH oxidase (H2O2-forming)
MVSGESDHFYARTALMYIYMGDLRYQDTKPYADGFWSENRIELVRDHVTRIDTQGHEVLLASGERLEYDRLLIAAGSTPNRFGWPGEYARGVQGLYSLGDLARMEENTRGISAAAVVGGGLIGMEMSEMLRSRSIPVTFLVREQAYMDYVFSEKESQLVHQAIRDHGVDLELGAELQEIAVDEKGSAAGVLLKDGAERPAQFVGLAVGVHPNIDLASASGIETGKGILISDTFQTSAPDVFAAGDCAEFRNPLPGRAPVEQLWYTGRGQGRQVAANLSGESREYRPPLFFNSAKFFDLEYQTYGTIGPAPKPGCSEVEYLDGGRSLRVAYSNDDEAVLGVNAFGHRIRQNVWSHWIRSREPVSLVMGELARGSFDPEFFRSFRTGSPSEVSA